MNKKFYIQTFGCAMNTSDSLMIESKFYEKGWEKVDNLEDSTFAIFNTCAVREKAENKALATIRGKKALFTKKGQRRLAVIGCSAQNKKDEIKEIIPFVSYIIGSDEYRKFDEILDNYETVRKGIFVEEDIEELYEDFTGNYVINGITAEISIARGCNNFCTYCIVPYTRGRERSRTSDSIVSDVNLLFEKGVREITLLGQNVNSYCDGEINFPKLITKILEETPIYRVRFLTSHPKDFSEELMDVIANNERVCKFIHLPIQAGSNSVLKDMNRGYTKEDYLQKIKLLRSKIPDVAISTDLIVGFSNESEEQFQETLDLIEEVRYDSAFTFHYSKRAGTKAAELLEDNVPEDVKLHRLARLIDVQNVISRDINHSHKGKEYEVLFTEKEGNVYKGRTSEFKIVVVESDVDLIGEMKRVLVEDSTTWALKSKVI